LVKLDLLYIDNLNINIIAKIAFIDFFCSNKYIYDEITPIERSQGFRKLDIYFGENNNYVILTLKYSKTNTEGISVNVRRVESSQIPSY
jgi:hypothetical protein